MCAAVARKTKEEIELERAVFGDEEGFFDEIEKFVSVDESEEDASSASGSDDGDLFFIDSGGSPQLESAGEDASDSEVEDDVPVWQDADDFSVDLTASNRLRKLRTQQSESVISSQDYERRLRAQFQKLYKPPKWASSTADAAPSDGSDADSDDEQVSANPLKNLLSQTSKFITKRETSLLPTSDIDIQRLADVTRHAKSQSVLQSICFHPTHPLVLTSGYDKTLRIYQLDGRNNVLVSSLHIKNAPFTQAAFHPDGRRVIAGLRRKYCFIWDLETGLVEKVNRLYGHEAHQPTFERFVVSADGRYIAFQGTQGYTNILSADTAQWVAEAKIDGDVADLDWSQERLLIASRNGHVYEFSMATKQFTSHWCDHGLVAVTKIARTSRWVAVGTESGVVCVYDLHVSVGAGAGGCAVRTATATIENLVTAIRTLEFSPDAQVLVVASSVQRDALRLVHVPSFSVFRNWPTAATPLGHVSCAAFSKGGQYLVAGNEGGSARLWVLNHYA